MNLSGGQPVNVWGSDSRPMVTIKHLQQMKEKVLWKKNVCDMEIFKPIIEKITKTSTVHIGNLSIKFPNIFTTELYF